MSESVIRAGRRAFWRDDACDPERVEDRSHLNMRPYTTARCLDAELVELRGNGVVAGCASPHDLLDDAPAEVAGVS
jgi:hypothetical protein